MKCREEILEYYIGLIRVNGANWANKANSDQRLIRLIVFYWANRFLFG